MGKVLLIIVMGVVFVATLGQTWIGVVAGYVVSVFGPQFVWPWIFLGVRPFLIVLVATMLSWGFGIIRGTVQLSAVRSKVAFWFAVWWFGTFFSWMAGPYVGLARLGGAFHPDTVMFNMSLQFGFMFVGMTCIVTVMQIRYLSYVLLLVTIYMTYWANDIYFSGTLFQRLTGPMNGLGKSLYKDENTFAMLFVLGCPYLYYLGLYFQKWYVRYGLWLVIPLAWHALFLTASRGGLLGLGVMMLVLVIRGKRKMLGVMMIVAFALAFVHQAGDVMKGRAAGVQSGEIDKAGSTRLEAWSAAIVMLSREPVTGVGVAAFIQAFPAYSDYQPRATHNTILEIYAESGVLSGTAWALAVLAMMIASLRANSLARRLPDSDDARYLVQLSDANLVALVGFSACSMFLSLKGYEIFFLFGLLTHATLRASRQLAEAGTPRDVPVAGLPGGPPGPPGPPGTPGGPPGRPLVPYGRGRPVSGA